jgi:hypothetical protein
MKSLFAVVMCSVLCSSAAFSAFCPDPAFEATLKTDQVRYLYEEPKNAAHQPIYNRMKEVQFLEKLSEFLSPLRLPRPLTLRLQGCDGQVNSYYWDYNVYVCYEYMESLLKYAPTEVKSNTLTRHDALVGMTVDVFLHETGHAIFDMLGVPFTGREEDVADEFATYIELQFAKEDARRLILGVSFLGREQGQEELASTPQAREFADVHGTPAQRYYNALCMAYGSDPDLYADALTVGHLPQARAKNCRYEYRHFAFAFKELITPYIDQTLLKKVQAQNWFRFDAAQ